MAAADRDRRPHHPGTVECSGRAWSLSPFTSLPSGQTGVDADFAGVAGLVLLPVIVVMVIALCCWLA